MSITNALGNATSAIMNFIMEKWQWILIIAAFVIIYIAYTMIKRGL